MVVSKTSKNLRLSAMLALLLTESEGRTVRIKDPIVASKLNQLKGLSKIIYASLVVDMAEQCNVSFSEAVKFKWSAIFDE